MLKSIRLIFVVLLVSTIAVSLDFPPPAPPGAIGPYLNGVFPSSTPGTNAWELEDPMPNMGIASPVRIIPYPESDDLLVLNKIGEVWRISFENQTKDLILDIKDRAYALGDAGCVGIALHPEFGDAAAPDKQLLFIYYRMAPNPTSWSENGFNRLSKFSWDAQAGQFDAASEEILFQQYDRSSWHNGGSMFFGPDGFLYLSLGDEGFEEFQTISTQRLDRGFFGGIIRIDVDNDPGKSHPIRRQPQANQGLPAGWTGETFSQGYSIPNDNPWLDPEGGIMEEFFAIGARSPHSMYFDPETGLIWLADVGSGYREEINLVEKGDNLQWPYMEGTIPSEVHEKPDPYIGIEKPVYFEYDRTEGSCVMGGSVYYGNEFPELNGKYLFADYSHNKLFALTYNGAQAEAEVTVLLSNLGGQPVDIPEAPGITGIFPTPDGQILVTIMGDYFEPGIEGKIFRLRQKEGVPDPPAKLSELGAFADLESLTPAVGILPYTVNAPLWSDRAIKKRWISVPNDGDFDTSDEQITFRQDREWTFPDGTVFIKHFELPTTTDPNGPTTRLETRFFVLGEDGVGYGLTYRWNADGTEAFLLGGGASRDFDIFEDGEYAYTQTWDFPSREQCMSCHTANAKYVLGVKTHQLNGDQEYPHLGTNMNQLEYFNESGMFHTNIGTKNEHPRAYAIDDESADLELRIRSYMDSNCASCHRLGGIPRITMDLRFSMPLKLANLVNFPTQSHSSNPNRLLVEPGDYEDSELWVRDASLDATRMPPIGRNLVDEPYIDALAEWIGTLPEDYGTFSEMLVFPNPSRGSVAIRVGDDWTAPYQLAVQSSNGQVVYQETSEFKSIFLDLNELAAGIYVLTVSDAQNNRHSEKLILQ
jgi:uncharacterized repeat protein (TIGR03806 family)